MFLALLGYDVFLLLSFRELLTDTCWNLLTYLHNWQRNFNFVMSIDIMDFLVFNFKLCCHLESVTNNKQKAEDSLQNHRLLWKHDAFPSCGIRISLNSFTYSLFLSHSSHLHRQIVFIPLGLQIVLIRVSKIPTAMHSRKKT